MPIALRTALSFSVFLSEPLDTVDIKKKKNEKYMVLLTLTPVTVTNTKVRSLSLKRLDL